MAQRLVLTSEKTGQLDVPDLARFVQKAQQHGQGNASASFTVSKGVLKITLSLPKDVRVVGKRVIKVKPKTKKQQAVEKQIADHKTKKKSGEEVEGYVPPVGRKTPPKAQKVKCPRCGIRKPISRVNKMRLIKPHQAKGEPCPGSGVQV